MKQKLLKRMAVTLFGAVLFFSCQKEIVEIDSKNNIQDFSHPFIGKKLENPYTVSNMRIAYENLKNVKVQSRNTAQMDDTQNPIQATDLYVKIFIQNADQLESLEADSLNYSILPLDYEIVAEGDLEIDPSTLTQQGYWIYSSIPIKYRLPEKIRYEIIAELFLPELEDDEKENSRKKQPFTKVFLEKLEDEALKITGNLDKDEVQQSDMQSRRPYQTPRGQINVENTTTGTIDPVIGIKIITRRWFKWGKGYTNVNGNYTINRTFKRNVNYEVVYKNSRGFKIWST